MYAKLVVGNAAISALGAMRDIGRLITSASPSISDIGSFNTSSSVIIDPTPAGWTYVGSVTDADRPTIADKTASTAVTADVNYNFVFSAPCLNSSALKYMALTNSWRSTTNQAFALTGASSATNLGILTNEGPRQWQSSAGAASNAEVLNGAARVNAGDILHIVASPRHFTIIQEGRGMGAIWESTQTDAHTFYGTAPFVQYCHFTSSIVLRYNTLVPQNDDGAMGESIQTVVFNLTDPNTGTYYGTYDPTESIATNPGKTYPLYNIGSLVQSTAGQRANTINTSGSPRYVVNPVFYSISPRGYPIQYVTGVVDVYWTGASIGTSGDIIDINGDSYTFFNCGTGFGLAMKTG